MCFVCMREYVCIAHMDADVVTDSAQRFVASMYMCLYICICKSMCIVFVCVCVLVCLLTWAYSFIDVYVYVLSYLLVCAHVCGWVGGLMYASSDLMFIDIHICMHARYSCVDWCVCVYQVRVWIGVSVYIQLCRCIAYQWYKNGVKVTSKQQETVSEKTRGDQVCARDGKHDNLRRERLLDGRRRFTLYTVIGGDEIV